MMEAESEAVSVYPREYMREYNKSKRLVYKLYPYALYAAEVLDALNADVKSIQKRRKQKKYFKKAYGELKSDYKYVFMDLYTSEGVMLMKLIHRETGLTVYEIARKYRGKQKAEMLKMFGSIWDQDLNVKFDSVDVDKITNHVILDIEEGRIPFDDRPVLIDKDEYKNRRSEYKEERSANKKRRRKKKRK